MEMTPMDVCLSDESLQNRISYFAYRISRRRPNTFSIEDGKQELWEAVINAFSRFVKGDVLDFASAAVYSRYGHIMDSKGNKAEDRYEHAVRGISFDSISSQYPLPYNLINAQHLLDKIESDLRKESWKGRQFILALESIQHLRKGHTRKETAKNIGISTGYLKTILARIKHFIK